MVGPRRTNIDIEALVGTSSERSMLLLGITPSAYRQSCIATGHFQQPQSKGASLLADAHTRSVTMEAGSLMSSSCRSWGGRQHGDSSTPLILTPFRICDVCLPLRRCTTSPHCTTAQSGAGFHGTSALVSGGCSETCGVHRV